MPCDNLQTDLTGLNFKLPNMLKDKDCVEFLHNQMIGFEPHGQIKKSIQIEILPCMENCYVHNFATPPLAIGLQEIKP